MLDHLYSQGFQEVLSLLGSLSVLEDHLFQAVLWVQGPPWCPLSLRDQEAPAHQVDLEVRDGHARPWGRSLLMGPGRWTWRGLREEESNDGRKNAKQQGVNMEK